MFSNSLSKEIYDLGSGVSNHSIAYKMSHKKEVIQARSQDRIRDISKKPYQTRGAAEGWLGSGATPVASTEHTYSTPLQQIRAFLYAADTMHCG